MCAPRGREARRYLTWPARWLAGPPARGPSADLRFGFEGQDWRPPESGTAQWTADDVEVSIDISGQENPLSQDMEQHLLRIAQEAVTNVLKHAGASRIWVKLHREARRIYLRIVDNGRGFEQQDVFADLGGNFGLIGMRERAERLGGELHLKSRPGEGTQVEVTVPLS